MPAAFEGAAVCLREVQGSEKGPEGWFGGPVRENFDCWAFILSYTQESVIHLANIYCVPTVSEAFCQGLASKAKGAVLVLLGGGNTNGLGRTAGRRWAQGARPGARAPVHPGVGSQGPLGEWLPDPDPLLPLWVLWT